MRSTLCVLSLLFVLQVVSFQIVRAQNQQVNKTLDAVRLASDSDIIIDGTLDEEGWKRAPKGSGFTQSQPYDGLPASEKTEVTVLYTDKYLFVGIMAYDSSPDSITASLFRRDGSEASDWVYVNIDSYNDNRTAFTFAANPLGVQKDIMYFNDTQEDVLWDAVWEVESRITENGWAAEFRIPLTQLRFSAGNDIQKWGINFQRRIARRGEISFWARTPREEFGLVSKFGEIRGIQQLARPLRLEVVPYVSGELRNDQLITQSDPSIEENSVQLKAGGDIKYGISSDFTLTATINPDFGQVEADPETFNLSQFEIFFEERRPFFLEGNEIFNFGTTPSANAYSSHNNFYSRRIGRVPYALEAGVTQFRDDNSDDVYSLQAESRTPITTIAGAGKVSGKTKKGLSVGILNAYTLQENAEFINTANNETGSFMIEPATNYLVGRIQQDINQGEAQIGGFFSSVNRNLQDSYLENYVHNAAYQAGIDGQYYWNDRNWGASGVLAMSSVLGSEEAILRTQSAPARYFNRTDSEYLSVDSTATSLTGYFGEFSFGKYSGSGIRYSFTYSEMSPQYEVNDIGFLERADYRAPHLYAEYLNVETSKAVFYLLWGDVSQAWNFDGDRIFNYYSVGGYVQLNNLWTVLTTAGVTGAFYNDRITRGGPLMRRPRDWNTYLSITSNTANNVYGSTDISYRRDAAGEYEIRTSFSLNARPTSYIQLGINPGYIKSKDLDQYQDANDYTGDGMVDYLFSNLNLDLFYTELRADITFSPQISLQTFLRPYYYTADFKEYKTFLEPRTFDFSPIDAETNEFFDNNFDIDDKTLQGNAILRYEYRPGSTIYLVWQQNRSAFDFGRADFQPFQGTFDTFKGKPVNIFLIKLSYWFGT